MFNILSKFGKFSKHRKYYWNLSQSLNSQLLTITVRLLISDLFNLARASCRSVQDFPFFICRTIFFARALPRTPSGNINLFSRLQLLLKLDFPGLFLAGAVSKSVQHSSIPIQFNFGEGTTSKCPHMIFFAK